MSSSVYPLVRDVTLRDGLQLAGRILPTDHKLRLARQLMAAGIDSLEIGAMVRPDRVPPMADTEDVIRRLTTEELAHCWVWVPNITGVGRALDNGARLLQFVLSVSDHHNHRNVGRSTEDSLADLPLVAEQIQAAGGQLQLGLSTAFTCPFAGRVPMSAVRALLNDPRAQLADSFVICDTIGQATPDEVTALIKATRKLIDNRWLVFHGHDTWGQGVANSLAALAAGADTVDASLGGLGGCPFAPGASGNTAMEDVLYALRPDWLTPGRFHSLVTAGQSVLDAVAEPQRSRAVEGARRSRGSHPWALVDQNTVGESGTEGPGLCEVTR